MNTSLEEISGTSFESYFDNLKKSVEGQNKGKELIKDLKSEVSELWKSRLTTLFERMKGFDIQQITVEQAYTIMNALKIIKESFSDGKELLYRVLVDTNNLDFSKFYDFCKLLDDARKLRDEEIQQTISETQGYLSQVIDPEELKRLIEKINEGRPNEALSLLKEEIVSISSSMTYFEGSELNEKIGSLAKFDPTLKDIKEFWGDMDKSWFGLLGSKLPGWSKNTLNNMSVGSNIAYIQIYFELKKNHTQEFGKIIDDIKSGNFDSLKKYLFNMTDFFGNLEKVGEKLGFKNNKYESEKYEVLNNPYQFSLLMKDSFTKSISFQELEKRVVDSKKEGRYQRVKPEDKESAKQLGDEMAKEIDISSYMALRGAGLVVKGVFTNDKPSEPTQSPAETSQPVQDSGTDQKPTPEQEEKMTLEKEMDDAGIDNPKVRKFILNIRDVKMRTFVLEIVKWVFMFLSFTKNLKGTESNAGSEKDILEGAREFLTDSDSLGKTIFAGGNNINGEISKEAFIVLSKHRPKHISWKEYFTKIFDKDSPFFKKNFNSDSGQISGVKDEKGNPLTIMESKDSKHTKKEIVNLDNLSKLIVHMDKENLFEEL